MKKGEYYFDHLSEQEKKEFIENLENENKSLKYYLSESYHSFSSFILKAFLWKTSKQSIRYWDEISLRKID